MACSVVNVVPCPLLASQQRRYPPRSQLKASANKSPSLSWTASFKTSDLASPVTLSPRVNDKHAPTLIQAAWTRRSSGQLRTKKSKKSWGQRTDKYMKPFKLDILISKRYINAKVMHRVTSKVVSVATTNAKDLRNTLPSLIDIDACKTIGKLLAERSKDADVFAVTYEPRKNEKIEGKLAVILNTIVENDIAII